MNRAIAASLIALTVTACEPKRIEVATPPANLLTCLDEPTAPSLPSVPWGTDAARGVQLERDKATLSYVFDLRSAWASCASAVEGVREWSANIAD